MYWLSRFICFLTAMMLVDASQLIWRLAVLCTEGCVPSEKAIIQFILLIIYNAATMYLPMVLLTYVAIRLVFAMIGLIKARNAHLRIPQAWAAAMEYTWPPARTRLLRDCLLATFYISIMALVVLTPGSPGYSFSMNGQHIIVDGQFTEYGLNRALWRFVRYCVEVLVFFAFCRSFDHFSQQHPSARGRQ